LGSLTLRGNSTYSGTTTISAGTLQIGNGTTGSLSTSSAVVNDANLLYGTTTTSGTYGLSSSTTGTGSLTGTAELLKLNGDITQSGNVSLSSGTNGVLYERGIELVSDTTITAGNITLTGDLGHRASSTGNLTLDTSATNGAITLDVSIGRSGDWYGFDSFTANAGTGTLTVSGANAGAGGWRGPSGASLTGALNISSSFSVVGELNLTATGNSSVSGNLSINGTNTWTVNPGLTMTVSGNVSGTNAIITKNGAGTLTLSGNNTYTGATTIESGTLQIGAGGTTGSLSTSSSITNNGTLAFNRSDNITQGTHFSTAAIGGTGSIVQNGAGNLTLNAANTYSGGTTLNTGTLVIGNTAAAGTGTITQTDGSSLLKFDTTGTVANAMSIYNVATNQTVTLSGAITAQNTTYDVASGTTTTLSGTISGSGGITKNGTGTLEVNGASNTYTGDTVVNAGTLEANASGALGASGNITVHNGGSILVQASNAIGNSSNVNLAGGTWGFNGNISDTVGALTLSANSTIDMDNGNISLSFASLASALTSSTRLNVYNYTLYSDHIYFTSNANLSSSLQYISFYSGFGTGFIGSSFIEGLSSPWQVQPVPEPETWATAALLLIGGGIWMWRKRKVGAGDRKCL
jgi:fibronectin-binding autotransporter adhesin